MDNFFFFKPAPPTQTIIALAKQFLSIGLILSLIKNILI